MQEKLCHRLQQTNTGFVLKEHRAGSSSFAAEVPTRPALLVSPPTFPHELALAWIHDLMRDECTIHHGVVSHGSKTTMLLDGSHLAWLQRAVKKGAQSLHRAFQILGKGQARKSISVSHFSQSSVLCISALV